MVGFQPPIPDCMMSDENHHGKKKATKQSTKKTKKSSAASNDVDWVPEMEEVLLRLDRILYDVDWVPEMEEVLLRLDRILLTYIIKITRLKFSCFSKKIYSNTLVHFGLLILYEIVFFVSAAFRHLDIATAINCTSISTVDYVFLY